MKTRELIFEKEKETKNKIRFKEVSNGETPPLVETLYIPKWYVGDVSKIKVTVEEV